MSESWGEALNKNKALFWGLVVGIVAAGVVFRCLVATQPYSGMGETPHFGDFEAQRHWMELTVNLPIREWYVNGPHNNLTYWGIDYPPLTAYFSWAWGKLFVSSSSLSLSLSLSRGLIFSCVHVNSAQVVVPDMVALDDSHGIETATTKAFMRMTAIVSDVLVYFTASIAFAFVCYKGDAVAQLRTIAFLILQPTLILVDHGHFQYNAVSLGFSLWAAVFVLADWDIVGSIFFVLAINYKQMALYYSPAFFFFLLGKCFSDKKTWGRAIGKFVAIGSAVIITMIVCWAPFLGSIDDCMHVVRRIFPVQRGLFEDKVANFWCAVSPFIKFRNIFSQANLVKTSFVPLYHHVECFSSPFFFVCYRAVTTLVGFAPAILSMYKDRSRRGLLLGMGVSSFSFYLFSYMVHEKTILFPLLPVTLLGAECPGLSLFTNTFAAFSMFPLLEREGLSIPYGCLIIFFALLCHIISQPRPLWIMILSDLFIIAYHVLERTVAPPARYPDTYALLNACASFAAFYSVFALIKYRLVRSSNPEKAKSE